MNYKSVCLFTLNPTDFSGRPGTVCPFLHTWKEGAWFRAQFSPLDRRHHNGAHRVHVSKGVV